MAGDYSRTSYNPAKHYSGVLLQQGRVQLDADWNEQHHITTHYLRALAADLIGPHGGPGDGFAIVKALDENGKTIPHDFAIAPGHYYVDGILCENDAPGPLRYSAQADLGSTPQPLRDGRYLVYLDVWEQEITALEDDDIREVALKGTDTAARSRVVWQVRVLDVRQADPFDPDDPSPALCRLRPRLSKAWLCARARQDNQPDEPCTISPDARYRGPENQLYRVQIWRGTESGPATYVWSRENASVELAITGVRGQGMVVESLGRDDRLSVAPGDLVEIADDDTERDPRLMSRDIRPLHRVRDVDVVDRLVTLQGTLPGVDPTRHPRLRRWDHGRRPDEQLDQGAVPVSEGDWLELEDGIMICFAADGVYQAGDYWQIPARTETGDVDWPGLPGPPELRPPRGVEHRYAPLRLITVTDSDVSLDRNYRRRINPPVTVDPND